MFPVKQNRASWTSAKLGIGVFSDCISLKKVKIPASLTSIPKTHLTMAGNWTVWSSPRTANWHLSVRMPFQNALLLRKLFSLPLWKKLMTGLFINVRNWVVFLSGGRFKGYRKAGFLFLRNGFAAAAWFAGSSWWECFFKCCNLTSVVIPPNVRYLGKWIFHGCNRLQYLEIRHDPEFIGEWIINKAATIRCYKGSKVDRYCQQSGFKVEYFS